MTDIYCVGCGKHPSKLHEYIDLAEECDYSSAEEAVICEEGTYNESNGHFYCTPCYIRVGMPPGVAP